MDAHRCRRGVRTEGDQLRSLRADLINAGADWIDQPVITDQGLVTSCKPDDLPDFCNKMIEEFAEDRHNARAAE